MKTQTKFKQTEIGMIPEDWEVKSISEVSEISLGGTPSTTVKEYWDGKIKWASAKDISNAKGRYVYETERRITEKGIANSAAKILPKNTIIITSRGTVGEMAMLSEPMSFNQTCYGLKAKKVNDIYLYYRLKSAIDYIKKVSYGTVFNTITMRSFDEIKLAIPTDENEQSSIAKTLSDFDSKIELNQQMNVSLEAIGQALFKHWFIDFEFPNEKGKPYKSSGGETVDSEVGEIPQGWVVGTLGDICDITMGQSPPGHSYNEDGNGLPFYQGIADFGFRFPSRRVYCTAPTRFAEEADVLLSVRAPVGTFNVAEERCAIGRGLAALRLKEKHNGFLYYLLRSTRSEWEKFEAEGTVFGSVTKSDVHDFKVVIPPQPLLAKFALLIEGLEGKININEKQSRNLTAIRDSLLPRLMSGKIRVAMAK